MKDNLKNDHIGIIVVELVFVQLPWQKKGSSLPMVL